MPTTWGIWPSCRLWQKKSTSYSISLSISFYNSISFSISCSIILKHDPKSKATCSIFSPWNWICFVDTLVLQIPCEKVFKYPKPTPKLLAEGIGAQGIGRGSNNFHSNQSTNSCGQMSGVGMAPSAARKAWAATVFGSCVAGGMSWVA